MNNFDFLKPVDKNLYDIISDAEELYRDEYFEQCIGQTRRFAENVCKNVLGDARTCEKTFDDMLATLKDKISGEEQEKEFIDDLYFIKREGNNAVHDGQVKNKGMTALECLQRAFEVAINYSVYYKKKNSNLLKLRFDTELLVTGKVSKESLAEKFEAEKARQAAKNRENTKKTSKKKTVKKSEKQYHSMKTQKTTNKNFSIFRFLLALSGIISLILVFVIWILTVV